MKAVLCKSLSGPGGLEIADIAEPEPGRGEILLDVSAVALNFFDTLITRGKYQYRPELPFSPGGEVAGIVRACGADAGAFRPGDRVMAYVKWNGCRERICVAESQAARIPEGVSDEEAAGLTITYGTAMHGLLDRGSLQAGETLVVLGATGGAGLAAVEIGHLIGADVVAAGTSDDKLAICRERGADRLINLSGCSDLKNEIRSLTESRGGADVIYDCIGGPYAEPALRATGWQGRYLVVGFAAGDIPRIPLNLVLLKGCSLIGVFFGQFAEREPERCRAHIERLLEWCREGRLKPHIDRIYRLEETAEALRALEDRKVKGKIIVKV